MRRTALLLVLALLAACGGPAGETVETSTDRLRLEVAFTPDPPISGEAATFELRVTNVSDAPAAMEFDTTQRGDVRLSTPDDVEVYRWSEQRAFSLEPTRVPVAPGQQVTFPLDEDPLPVAPGEYKVLATTVGVPKLQVAQTTVTVAGAPGGSEEPPTATSEAPTATPSEPSGAIQGPYGRLLAAAGTSSTAAAVPLAGALTGAEAGDTGARGAVLRQELGDALADTTFTELLMAQRVVAGGDAGPAQAAAQAAAQRVVTAIGGLRSVDAEQRASLAGLLSRHVDAVGTYAAVVASGDTAALEEPREEMDDVDGELGQLVSETSGGELETAPAAQLFGEWSDAVRSATESQSDRSQALGAVHTAAATAVDPVATDLGEAYARHLDLAGYDTPAARLRARLAADMTDEVFLLGAVAAGTPSPRATAREVLDRNAGQVAEAIGEGSAIDASEEEQVRARWRDRDARLLDRAAAVAGGGAPAAPSEAPAAGDDLAAADQAVAQTLADATDGAVSAREVQGWLGAQRDALREALAAFGS